MTFTVKPSPAPRSPWTAILGGFVLCGQKCVEFLKRRLESLQDGRRDRKRGRFLGEKPRGPVVVELHVSLHRIRREVLIEPDQNSRSMALEIADLQRRARLEELSIDELEIEAIAEHVFDV